MTSTLMILQPNAFGREHLDNEKAKSIIEFGNAKDINWDEDMLRNLDMHKNYLEQFTDVKQDKARKMKCSVIFGDLPWFLACCAHCK